MICKGLTKQLAFAVVASAFGSSFQVGYNLYILNFFEKPITDWIATIEAHRNGQVQLTDFNSTKVPLNSSVTNKLEEKNTTIMAHGNGQVQKTNFNARKVIMNSNELEEKNTKIMAHGNGQVQRTDFNATKVLPNSNFTNVKMMFEDTIKIIDDLFAKFNQTWNTTVAKTNGQEQPTYNNGYSKIQNFILYLKVTFYVGAIIGGALTGVVANHCGRKKGLLYTNVLVLLAVICVSSSKAASSYELLFIGRFFIGINVGLNSGLTPMYLIEIAPVNLRGAVGFMYPVFFGITNLIAYILYYVLPLISLEIWHILLSITVVPAIFQVLTLPFCPESPKYLLFSKGCESEAQKSLSWFRGTLDVQDEMARMKTELDAIKLISKGILRNIINKSELRMPLYVAVYVMFSRIWSGHDFVIYYSSWIEKSAGVKNTIIPSFVLLGFFILTTVVTLYLVEKVGRKRLLLIGYAGMALAATLLSILSALQQLTKIYATLGVALVFVFTIMYACGPSTIPWLFVSELFNQHTRPRATALVLIIYWTADMILKLLYPTLLSFGSTFVCMAIAGVNAWYFIVVFLKAPETKNKPIEEICAFFKEESNQQQQLDLIPKLF